MIATVDTSRNETAMTGVDDCWAGTPRPDLNAFLSPSSFWLPDRIVTSAWLQHAPFAFWLMDALRPRRLVELGTHHGYSYLAFCQAARRLELDARFFAIDTWAGDEHAGTYPEQVLRDLQAYHDPRFADFSRLVRGRFDETAVQFEDGSVDLLHIDGRHFYQDAKEDFEIWRPKLSDRSIVLFHDTNVRERGFGVWRLWAELASHRPSFEFLHGHGLGVMGFGADLPQRVRTFFAVGAAQCDVVRETYFRLGSAIEDRLAIVTRQAPQALAAPPPSAGSVPRPLPTTPATVTRAAPRLHVHVAAMAPHFLDVRTRLPLRELGKVQGIATSFSQQKIELPRLSRDQPKVLVLQRAGVRDNDRWRGIIGQVLERGWVLVTEIDDHPELMAAVHKCSPDEAMWDSVRLAHAAQTSTAALAEAIRPRNGEVAVFPNAAFKVVDSSRQPAHDGSVRVFYGALNRERFSRQVGAVLAPFAAANRQVEFLVVHDRAFFESIGDCSKEFTSAVPYEDYLRLMGSCDVALMPLEGGPGERFKSDIKWVEASSLGLATIASPVVYADTVRNGVNGLLAEKITDWPLSLAALVEDWRRRVAIASAARDEVAQSRMFERQSNMRIEWYEALWRRRFELTDAMNKQLQWRGEG